jgi:septal ring factor EnvC (AmiA/AmiB activator)
LKRALPMLNFFGVLVLAVVCVVQWQRDRALNLEIQRLEKTRQQQEAKLAEQEKAARGLNEDLGQFKQRFQQIHGEATGSRTNLQRLERDHRQLIGERDQERDAQLKEAASQIRDLSARLNESVTRYNQLTTNYNAAIQRFNELATNYNSVVEQLNAARKAATREAAASR